MTPLLPFNSLPPLPPASFVETSGLLKAVVQAERALAELKGFCQTLPNPALLINTIALQESKASSAIENIITTNDELYQAVMHSRQAEYFDEISDAAPANAKEVLRYRQALYKGYYELQQHGLLTTNVYITIAQTIKNTNIGLRRTSGVCLKNPVTGEIVYTPPEGEELIRAMLHDLERFIHDNNTGLEPLVRMALIHYQFEAIHPFVDGNGRTGRILMVLYLVQQGLLDMPVLFLSSFIIKHKAQYYELLRAVTEREAWHEWCVFMVQGVATTAQTTLEKIQQIRTTQAEMTERAHVGMKRGFSRELIDIIFQHPYCKIQTLVERKIAQRQTASVYLQDLVTLGILQPMKIGREIYFVNTALMQILGDGD